MENDLIRRQDAINKLLEYGDFYASIGNYEAKGCVRKCIDIILDIPPTQLNFKEKWTPVTEKLPKINERVLVSTNGGRVLVAYRDKPTLIWQVTTEKDGRKRWIYDPEAYTDDIDSLPKAEDCSFIIGPTYDALLSVTSMNYDYGFEGVVAWMPRPLPAYQNTIPSQSISDGEFVGKGGWVD